MKDKLDTQYTIGRINRTTDGYWSVSWFGMHAAQGGYTMSNGSMSAKNLPDLLKIVSKNMEDLEEYYDNMIKTKED